MRGSLVAAFLLVGAILPSAGCDRIVKARFHVTSTTGEALGDALRMGFTRSAGARWVGAGMVF